MKKILKVGVFGIYRGSHLYKAILSNNAEVVAVCDRDTEKLKKAKEELGSDLAVYTDFDEFINHEGLDAVYLANNFDQHAPFAIKALEKNIHVLSECTSNSTMAEGVALVRAAEKSSATYMIAENYVFMKFNKEIDRLYKSGKLGKFIYGEGEYNHPLDPTNRKYMRKLRPYEKHWRNTLPRSYYITHSIGPLMYITGAFPRRVSALPVFAPHPTDPLMGLGVGDRAAIITTLNHDDSVYRVTGCAAFGAHSKSYRVCGIRGQAENIRGESGKVLVRYNEWEVPEGEEQEKMYVPEWNDSEEELIEASGHGGGDFLVIREFFECIRENKKPVMDVYFATTMASVAILAHRSILENGIPYDIPDFRVEEDRIWFENDTLTPFWSADGSVPPSVSCCSKSDFIPLQEDVEAYKKLLKEDG